MFFTRRAGHRFYDRGDMTSHDFITEDFTTDGFWHTLSLADMIPIGSKFVWAYLAAADDAGIKVLRLRKTGYSGEYQFPTIMTPAANVAAALTTIIPCSTAREIDYLVVPANWIQIELNILGWIK